MKIKKCEHWHYHACIMKVNPQTKLKQYQNEVTVAEHIYDREPWLLQRIFYFILFFMYFKKIFIYYYFI